MGLREFAEQIGVAPDTCTSAEKDRRRVRPITINAYALATGVDRHWLETGEIRPDDGPDGGETSEKNGRNLVVSMGRTRTLVPVFRAVGPDSELIAGRAA